MAVSMRVHYKLVKMVAIVSTNLNTHIATVKVQDMKVLPVKLVSNTIDKYFLPFSFAEKK